MLPGSTGQVGLAQKAWWISIRQVVHAGQGFHGRQQAFHLNMVSADKKSSPLLLLWFFCPRTIVVTFGPFLPDPGGGSDP